MVSGLSCSQEEQELLRKESSAGNKVSLERLINSFLPMIVECMKRYAPRVGYNCDVFMKCVEKMQEKVVNTLYYDNSVQFEMISYISWMVRDEGLIILLRRIAFKKKHILKKWRLNAKLILWKRC